MRQHYCVNIGGKPRYVINNGQSNQDVMKLYKELVARDLQRIAGSTT